MLDNGGQYDESTFQAAARKGNIDLMQWLLDHGCPWDEWCCHVAAQEGNVKALEWLRCKGCPWSVWTAEHACITGHLDVIKWMHHNDFVGWNTNIAAQAAYAGHLDILRFLHESIACPRRGRPRQRRPRRSHRGPRPGAPPATTMPVERTNFAAAAWSGNTTTMDWLLRHGCSWDADTCRHALLNYQLPHSSGFVDRPNYAPG